MLLRLVELLSPIARGAGGGCNTRALFVWLQRFQECTSFEQSLALRRRTERMIRPYTQITKAATTGSHATHIGSSP